MFLGDMDVVNRSARAGVTSLTPTGFLWAHMRLEIASVFNPNKTPYQR